MCETKEESIAMARQMIKNSSKIVCLLGVGMEMECGLPNMKNNATAYRIEETYGYSPEEIFSATFFNTRPAKFFECYKKESLADDYIPSEAFDALVKLEKSGKIKGCITESIYGLAKKAGVSRVTELHGSIENNWCPKCKASFTADYMRSTEDIPTCKVCKKVIRPGITLTGEMMRNDIMTEAANMIMSADMVMVLGTNMNDELVQWGMRYYMGEEILLISKFEHFSDKWSKLVIHDEVKEILPQLIQ